MVQQNSDDGTLCRTPKDYVDGKQLAGLMTLNNFAEGGHEVTNGRILVCVKSIGGRKKSKNTGDLDHSSNALGLLIWS